MSRTKLGSALAATLIAAFTVGPAVPASAAAAHKPSHRAHHHRHPTRRHHRRNDLRHGVRLTSCTGAMKPATAGDVRAMRRAVLCLVNRQRVAHGLPALHLDPRLDGSAQRWTDSMVATDLFSHGTDFAARISASGFPWAAAGENIATGYPTPASVVSGWMASAGHCRNILDPSYRSVGVGVVASAVSGWASGPATWTEDFALGAGRAAPSKLRAPAAGCPY